MLISAIATLQAIDAQHRAGLSMMQAHQNTLSLLRSVGAGETNFHALHQKDLKNDTDCIKAQLMYELATQWRDHSQKQLKKELNYKA